MCSSDLSVERVARVRRLKLAADEEAALVAVQAGDLYTADVVRKWKQVEECCECGGGPATWQHLVWDCAHTWDLRQ